MFALAHWRNGTDGLLGTAGELTPTRMIDKPPTANPRPDQKALLDRILDGLVECDLSPRGAFPSRPYGGCPSSSSGNRGAGPGRAATAVGAGSKIANRHGYSWRTHAELGHHAKLFQRRRRQVLRLVDYQQHASPSSPLLD